MKRSRESERPALDLVEETYPLLLEAGPRALACHLAGAFPFLLGLLYFWSDMARGIYAEQRLMTGAWVMTLLFIWMKGWQAIFAGDLLARLRGEEPKLTARRWLRATLGQAILQPSGLFLLPIALLIAVPFGWVYAFYQNLTVLGGGEESEVKRTLAGAWQQAALWPMQNHNLLFMLVLFGLLVAVNVGATALILPFLLKLLLGIQSAITRSPEAALNSTFLAATVALAWLCVDPFVKAAYALRCFHGGSLKTGDDLRAELRRLAALARPAPLVLLGLLAGFASSNLPAAQAEAEAPSPARPAPAAAPSLSPAQVNRSIEEVLQQREYTWRLLRERLPKSAEEKGKLTLFLESIWEVIVDALRKVGRWVADLIKWIFSRSNWTRGGAGLPVDWVSALKAIFVLLVAVLVGLLAWGLFRLWRQYGRRAAAVQAERAGPPSVDLADDDVGAEQLPDDGWLRLARELLERGELRLALRALYLASLAHLADRGLIVLARFKSNRDYERELDRRGHALPEVPRIFSENVAVFDRVWYGRHEVSADLVSAFAGNVEKMRGQATAANSGVVP